MKNEPKNISIHFPYTPHYNVDFLNKLLQMDGNFYTVLTDTRSNEGIHFGKASPNLNVKKAPIYRILGLWYSSGLIWHLFSKKPSIFVVNANPRDIGTLLVVLLGLITKTKVVPWGMFHRIGEPKIHTTIYFWIMGLLGHANFTYARVGKISQLARGVKSKKVHVIGTAICKPSLIDTADKNFLDEMISSTGLSNTTLANNFVLIQVMRLSEIKKPFALITLMKKLKHRGLNIILILVGGGMLEKEFKTKILQNNLQNSIFVLGPIYSEDILAALYSISDVCVVPTCIGLTAHQSLHHGVPIVTDNSIINQASEFEVLKDGYNSRIYEEGDIEDFANIVEELMQNRSYLNSLKNNCKNSLNEYSIERKVINFIRAINSI